MPRPFSTLLAAITLTAACPAHAVSLSADGLGQVLIYPYYTVRSSPQSGTPYNVLLSVVNGAMRGKAVKVRFREALAGASVFEINVFLSLRDVWTAGVVPYGEGAAMVSNDRTCTVPSVAFRIDGHPDPAGVFTSRSYSSDPIGSAPDRVREGFIEVLEMGEIRPGTPLEAATVHVAGNATCALPVADQAFVADLDPPTGRLYGSATLVDVMEGTAYAYDAVALDGWSSKVQFGAIGGGPLLTAANPAVSSIVDGQRLLTSTWTTGIDAVNAVLSASTLETEFMREASVAGATDVAYALPTRPLLVDANRALPPFSARLTAQGACERVSDSTLDRNEGPYDPNGGPHFPELVPYGALCWTTTVQSFNASSSEPTRVLGSRATLVQIQPGDIPYFPPLTRHESGVALLYAFENNISRRMQSVDTTITDLQTGTQTHAGAVAYTGLPMLAVNFVRYVNEAVVTNGQNVLSNYGTTSGARRTRAISLP